MDDPLGAIGVGWAETASMAWWASAWSCESVLKGVKVIESRSVDGDPALESG